jgi:hypothetical protein
VVTARAGLNAVAMFFLKRAFPHVRYRTTIPVCYA